MNFASSSRGSSADSCIYGSPRLLQQSISPSPIPPPSTQCGRLSSPIVRTFDIDITLDPLSQQRTLLEIEKQWLRDIDRATTTAMTMEATRSSRRRRGASEGDFAPSRAKSGEDLRGHTARTPSDWTVRPVTPESIPEGQPFSANATEPFDSSAPTSPFGTARDSPGYTSRHHRLRSGSNNERGQAVVRDTPTRPRTRTLDERGTREASPSGLLMKGRQRIGSIASASSSSYNDVDDAVASIGHPSVIPGGMPFDLPLQRHNSEKRRIGKNIPRDLESIPSSSPPTRQPTESPPQLTLPEADTEKILHLTKSVRGRMEGSLAFRRGDSSPWASAYCSINDELGSLVYETRTSESTFRTLIPDLRGCYARTKLDSDSQMPYICISPQNSKLKVHLRPHTQDEFENWYAALLCWRPIRPKGILNKMTKPQAGGVTATGERRPLLDTRRHSEVSLLREAPIIKVGKMIFWDTNVSYSYVGTPKAQVGSKPSINRMQSLSSKRWRRVSCTLRENGELKLYTETDVQLVSCVQLSQLSRCAIQRLDPSVLDNEWSIGIFPQYSASSKPSALLRPIFLSLESRVLYEVWLVLLRAFTVPQLYGPKAQGIASERSPNGSRSSRESTPAPSMRETADMFRMEKSLAIRVMEARLTPEPLISPKLPGQQGFHQRQESVTQPPGFFAEVLLDGETRAKTMVKSDGFNPFWREEFEFQDLPAVISVASIVLKKRPPNSTLMKEMDVQKEMKKMYDSLSASDGGSPNAAISFDQTFAKVDIYLDDVLAGGEVEKWWPLTNLYGHQVGEVSVRVEADESIILMARDYQPMSELLHRFTNGLTLQLSQMLSQELKRLSECLLNIFQVSGSASDWLMALVEEEIDGTFKESPASRFRYSKRIGSNDSSESSSIHGSTIDRELIVRDMGKTASLEANLLFRGNTLLTKSLDLHMRRLGREYLEETLGDKIREITDRDPDCEVDPNRISNANDLDRNWRRLISLTQEIWKSIAMSAHRCPAELRYIFRRIRACAEDRYGDFLRSVSYSSVSGFLFLRFFCPAILNPKLFSLVKDHPKPNARRTFTLIAKSIQTLANVGTFGAKEQWMEPMNSFLGTYRQGFKTFLDDICSISSATSPQSPIPPSYSTPLQILQRLPPTSREGFPSLPYLIDHARNFATLVNLWLDHCGPQASNIHEGDGDLLIFHQLCQRLRQRTEDCLAKAERAERPSSVLSTKWDELVEQLASQSQQRQELVIRPQLQPSNGVRSQPESPSIRGHDHKLSLEMPTVDERTPAAARHGAQLGHPQSPVSASTTTSQYQTSESHDEPDADSDTTPLRAGTTAPEPLSEEDDEKFFGGRMNPSSSGYGLSSGFAAARAEAALIKEKERLRREQKERKRAELTRDLQLSLAQPMHSSQGSVSGNSIFGPYKGEYFASSSSGRASSERSAERPRSESEKERERQRQQQQKRGEERHDRYATPLKDRFREERPSLSDEVRSPSVSSPTGTSSSKKLHRGEPARRQQHQRQHSAKPSEEMQQVKGAPSLTQQNAPAVAPASVRESGGRSRGPSRQGHNANAMSNFTNSSASSDNEGAGPTTVTALPKMSLRPQRQRTLVERERDMVGERNAAAEKSLVDRLLSTASKKKKPGSGT